MTLSNWRLMTEATDRWVAWVGPVLAQAAPPGEDQVAPGGLLEFLASPLNLILISAILFMFLVARPQQKARQQQEKAQAELKKNDRIVTHSGIHGIVVQLQDGLVTIRIDENSGARMTVNRDSIATITPSETKE